MKTYFDVLAETTREAVKTTRIDMNMMFTILEIRMLDTKMLNIRKMRTIRRFEDYLLNDDFQLNRAVFIPGFEASNCFQSSAFVLKAKLFN
jgi:hypothetical protein